MCSSCMHVRVRVCASAFVRRRVCACVFVHVCTCRHILSVFVKRVGRTGTVVGEGGVGVVAHHAPHSCSPGLSIAKLAM